MNTASALPHAFAARIKVLAFTIAVPLLAMNVSAQTTTNEKAPVADVNPKALLERADEIRFPKGGFEMDVVITSLKPNEEKETRRYKVMSKGKENSIVQTTEPAADRGQSILMRGRDLWLYVPDVSQPVRLSFSQRLTGQVANGDIARANFSGDYDATVSATDMLNNEAHTVLDLVANDKAVTYAKVKLWLRASDGRPAKAEFYAVSGRLLKTALYEGYSTMLGRARPTKLTLTDAVKQGEVSIMEYTNMKARADLQDRMFSKEYLRKLD